MDKTISTVAITDRLPTVGVFCFVASCLSANNKSTLSFFSFYSFFLLMDWNIPQQSVLASLNHDSGATSNCKQDRV